MDAVGGWLSQGLEAIEDGDGPLEALGAVPGRDGHGVLAAEEGLTVGSRCVPFPERADRIDVCHRCTSAHDRDDDGLAGEGVAAGCSDRLGDEAIEVRGVRGEAGEDRGGERVAGIADSLPTIADRFGPR